MNKLILAITILAACDTQQEATACPVVADLALADPAGFDAPAISLREQGPPLGIYITSMGGDSITRDGFVKLINACSGLEDPALTCSLSWYQPDTTQTARVMGLGCSAVVSEPLWSCYRAVFDKLGGINY